MVSGSQCATSELNSVDDFQSDERLDQMVVSLKSHRQGADPYGLSAYTMMIAVQQAPDQLMSHDIVWTEDSH